MRQAALFQLFLPAAAGVVGPAFQRAAVNITITGTFTGYRMGYMRRFQE
jgi:hypothetical protein